jgi:non-ribosomal peptide synthetase component E (peptide arylation enzyme)
MPITTQDYQIDPGMPLRGLTLPQLFTGAVAEGGDRPAVTDGERSWSWRQWQVDVDALTAALHDLGVRPGDVVAVQLPNSWEFLVTHLAIATAGTPGQRRAGAGQPAAAGRRPGAGPASHPP